MNELTRKQLIKRLNSVDWNFPRATTPPSSVHAIHWFPGNFIPQIPSFLVQLLSETGDIVFDPFCGSGTTPIEALKLGRAAQASDVNRASIHVTIGKVALLSGNTVKAHLRALQTKLLFDFELGKEPIKDRQAPYSPELRHWFHAQTYAQLQFLWDTIQSVPFEAAKHSAEVIFADTLFACASPGIAVTKTGKRRRHHWGWIADNVIPLVKHPHNAVELFRKRLHHAISILEHAGNDEQLLCAIKQEDARHLSLSSNSVDLIVTSPPYIGMIDYALANRLTYLWMAWPLPQDLAAELGARRFRNRPTSLLDYLEGMEQSCREMKRVLRSEAYCAIVIGASRAFPTAVNSLIQVFSRHLVKVWGPVPRVPTRRRVSERLGTAPSEFICVFQKP